MGVLLLNDGQLDDIRRGAPDEIRSDAETFVKAAKAAASSNNPSDFEAGNVQPARSRMVLVLDCRSQRAETPLNRSSRDSPNGWPRLPTSLE